MSSVPPYCWPLPDTELLPCVLPDLSPFIGVCCLSGTFALLHLFECNRGDLCWSLGEPAPGNRSDEETCIKQDGKQVKGKQAYCASTIYTEACCAITFLARKAITTRWHGTPAEENVVATKQP